MSYVAFALLVKRTTQAPVLMKSIRRIRSCAPTVQLHVHDVLRPAADYRSLPSTTCRLFVFAYLPTYSASTRPSEISIAIRRKCQALSTESHSNACQSRILESMPRTMTTCASPLATNPPAVSCQTCPLDDHLFPVHRPLLNLPLPLSTSTRNHRVFPDVRSTSTLPAELSCRSGTAFASVRSTPTPPFSSVLDTLSQTNLLFEMRHGNPIRVLPPFCQLPINVYPPKRVSGSSQHPPLLLSIGDKPLPPPYFSFLPHDAHQSKAWMRELLIRTVRESDKMLDDAVYIQM